MRKPHSIEWLIINILVQVSVNNGVKWLFKCIFLNLGMCCWFFCYALIQVYFVLLFLWQPWLTKLTSLRSLPAVFQVHIHTSLCCFSTLPAEHFVHQCPHRNVNEHSDVSHGVRRVRSKPSLPVCLWGDTTIMSMRPSTLASTVSLLRPVCLSTRWMDFVCQSVQ